MSVLVYLTALAGLYLLGVRALKAGLKRLSCHRTFSCPAAFAGSEGQLVETVRNDSPYMIPWLRLECRITPHLRLGRQENLQVSADAYYSSLFTLMPYQQIRRTHRVTFLHRGAYDLGRVSMTAGDVLGLTQLRRKQELQAPVLVYPRLLEDCELPAPVSRILGDIVTRRQLLEDPFLVRGIRTYYPGDPVRDIHWPATARTGEAQVRVRDYTAQTKLLVVLNVQREDLQWHDRLAEEEEEAIEYGISMAATLCLRALRMGLCAGFAANMPLDDGKENTVMLPVAGTAREEELLTAFARLKTVRTQPLHMLLESLTLYSGLDILILSCYENDGIRDAMAQLRRGGNQVSLCLLEGGAV